MDLRLKITSKKCLILFELLIAIALCGILISLLLRFFVNSVRVDQKIDALQAQYHEIQQLQSRLSMIFSAIPTKSSCSLSTLPQDPSSLIFTFDQGVDPNPAFSGILLGQLLVDKQDNLMLILWPIEKTQPQPYRTELILRDVHNLSWEFLGKKNPTQPDSHSKPVGALMEWNTQWSSVRTDLPSTIRLTLRHQDRNLEFAFHLPVCHPVIYQTSGDKR